MIDVDLLIRDIRQLVNPGDCRPLRGDRMGALRVLRQAWLASKDGLVVFLGTEREFREQCRLEDDARVIDGAPFIAMPGFVDPHTHLPFGGTRQDEFGLKLKGISYQEIARRGGGIMNTVRRTRECSREELLRICRVRADAMLLSGTTTAEAKSGYGLDRETEIKQLEVLADLRRQHPLEIVSTFMGAHEVPEAYKGRNRDFLTYLLNEVAPIVKERKLAEFADIFCEDGYFSVAETADYLERMADLGFKKKLHADEFTSNGAGSLAARLSAVSAEHLIALTDPEIDDLASASTVCVLLPGVSFFLRLGKYAPARRLLDRQAYVALGTDFNPGSSMISSMLLIFHLAVFQMGLTIEEALNAVTINAAAAIDRADTLGSLDPGKSLDLLLLDIPDYEYLAYHPGIQPIHTVLKGGKEVIRARQRIDGSGTGAVQ